MNGWSSHADDRWGNEPAWVYEITWEWEPVPGQRYPGDPGRRKAVHTPVYEASPGIRRIGRASVAPGSAAPAPSGPGPRSGPEEQPPARYLHQPVSNEDPPTYDPRRPQGRENLSRDGSGYGPRPASVPPRQRDQPSWNRPAQIHERLGEDRREHGQPGSAPVPDQRRGSTPVYGRPAAPVSPSLAAPVSPPRQPAAPVSGSAAHPPAAPVSGGRPAVTGTGGVYGASPVSPAQQGGQHPAPGGYYGRRPGADAFPAHPGVRPAPNQRDGHGSDVPFDLRPAPHLGAREPARPAPQPTRMTPTRPATPPAPVYPVIPGRDGPRPPQPGADRPVSGQPFPELPVSAFPATADEVTVPVRPMSPPAAPPVSPAAQQHSAARELYPPRPDQYDVWAQQYRAPAGRPGPEPAGGAGFPPGSVAPEADPAEFDAPEPVTAPPAAVEPVTAPPATSAPPAEAEPDRAGDEPHGLGWLLSMSGLGATTPVSEETLPPPAEPRAPEPVEIRPVSAAPEKQDWFAPLTGAQPIVTGRGTEPEPAAAAVEDAGHPPAGYGPAEEPPADADAEAEAQPEPVGAEPDGPGLVITLVEARLGGPMPPGAETIDAQVIEGELIEAEAGRAETPAAREPEAIMPPRHVPLPAAPTQDRPNAQRDAPVAEAWQPEPQDEPPGVAEPPPEDAEPESPATEDGQERAEAPAPDDHEATAEAEPLPEPEPEPRREPVPAARREPLRQARGQGADPKSRRADPEQVLAAYPWTFDPETLREEIDEIDPMWVVIDRLTDKLEYAERDTVRARLLSLRAVAERLLGEVDAALEDARTALEHARAAGDLRQIALVRARLAHVLHWRGDYAEADRLYAESDSPELPAALHAEVHELAGRSAFEQGRHLEAVNHFESALDLRRGADPEMVERIEVALDTIAARTAGGWGPYPRGRAEILGISEEPRPMRDERSGLWGYVGAVPPRYAQAQPFAEGVAWVHRPDAAAWELIDHNGEVVIDAAAGYRAAGGFAEGLAWVSRDPAGGWFAVDRQNQVVVPGGFDDARPFRHGLALVRQGGWGAVDRQGRLVVEPRYRAFATSLAAGGPVDGFTEEGLAVVDVGDRFGVVDRSGRLVVTPVHATVVIHPAAFLVADQYGLWGALDRQGRPLIELTYKKRSELLDELDRRLTGGRPVV